MNLTFGVSPAYFVSVHGVGFGPAEISSNLPDLASMGFTSYQIEVFDQSALELWTPRRTAALRERAINEGLRSEVFVAHFLGHEFASARALFDPVSGSDGLSRVIEAAAAMSEDMTVVVPILPLSPDTQKFRGLWTALVAKLVLFARAVKDAGLRLGVETVPGGLVSSSSWYERLAGDTDEDIGYVLDTGNAWAAGEIIPHVVERLGDRITATHLCNAADRGHRSTTPGTGDIDWPGTFAALRGSVYGGSLDIEVACSATETRGEYQRGLEYLKTVAVQTEDGGIQHG